MAHWLCFSIFIFATFISGSWEQKVEKICDLPCKKTPMEVAFVIDSSSSIYPANFTEALWFVGDFVDVFDISPDKIRVASVTYGARVYTNDAFGFDAYTEKRALKQAITNIPYRGGQRTETGAGIRYMRETFLPAARPKVKKICIVLTDGNSQEGAITAREARTTRETGVEMFAIGIGRDISEQELRNIAGDDNHVFTVSSYNLLGTLRSRLAYETCDKPPSWPVVCRDNPIDISLVVDASSSIGPSNFTIGLKFLQEFVKGFDVNPRRARFSVITYGRGTYDNTAFDFDAYPDEVGLVDAISKIPYTAGDYTDTGLGIEFMRKRQMLPNLRPHAAHIAVVLTDGQSQDWQKTKREAKKARDAGITMFAIGVGRNILRKELDGIAGQKKRVFTANDYKALETIKSGLDLETCNVVARQFNHPRPVA